MNMENLKNQYLDLLKKTLIDFNRIEMKEYFPVYGDYNLRARILGTVNSMLSSRNLVICKQSRYTKEDRIEGRDLPLYADTMIGLKRLENIEFCFNEIIKNKIEGDFIETGVWRGGATIFMKALLDLEGITNRKVWIADSFEGLPKPNAEKYEADKDDKLYKYDSLRISEEVVRQNFIKYNLLDNNVKFLKGWFKDTLPVAPIEKLALLRLDGDMYESTMDGLVNLYPKLSKGGYIIVDDYNAIEGCKKAITDYRNKHNITSEIFTIDWAGIYWKKE